MTLSRLAIKSTLHYWVLLLLVSCIIFFTLDSLLLYTNESLSTSYPRREESSNVHLLVHKDDALPHNHQQRAPIQPRTNSRRRQMIIDNLTWALKPENRQITLIVNSCGRLDLLQQTLDSFDAYYASTEYTLYERIIVDDSRNNSVAHELIRRYYPKYEIILTANNEFERAYTHRDERITFAMDKLYSQVVTPWIFHIEDDWLFSRTGFLTEAFDIFETAVPETHQTGKQWIGKDGRSGLVNKFPNEYRYPEGNQTAIDHFFFDANTLYSVVLCWNMYRQKPWCNRTYMYEYKGSQWYNMKYHLKRGVTWGGFSFNAGLQPTFLYAMYGKFFSPLGEWGKSEQMIQDGLKVALIAPPACDHLGRGRHVDSGELVRAEQIT